MVSLRVFCYLLIFFILQLHGIVSDANFDSQAPRAANSEGFGTSTSITQVFKKATQDFKSRKILKHVKVNIDANGKNGLEIESKELVRKRKNEKKLTRTVSLTTADYSNPGHHPPRHN